MSYTHFSIEERETIQYMLWQKASVRAIAKALGRNHSSVSREIVRNRPPERNRYTPRLAHERSLKNRTRRCRTDRLKNETLRAYVVSHLKRGWSPEQIAGTAEDATCTGISHEAIWRMLTGSQPYE